MKFANRSKSTLEARENLMIIIAEVIRKNGWTQTEAAEHCGVTQPCISYLLNHHIERFSLAGLFHITTQLGLEVTLTVKNPPRLLKRPKVKNDK